MDIQKESFSDWKMLECEMCITRKCGGLDESGENLVPTCSALYQNLFEA